MSQMRLLRSADVSFTSIKYLRTVLVSRSTTMMLAVILSELAMTPVRDLYVARYSLHALPMFLPYQAAPVVPLVTVNRSDNGY